MALEEVFVNPLNSEHPLRRGDWRVMDVPLAACQKLVRSDHYAQGGSNTGTYCHGLLRVGDPNVYGIAWWIPPTKGAGLATYPDNPHSVLALSRLVVLPGVPKNGASFLLGRSERIIRRDGAWRCLVTYADEWQGHTGAIYRATNWEYMGLTKPEAVWVDGQGRMVARKAGPVTRTKAEMEALGYRCLGRHAKHKFRKVLPAIFRPVQEAMAV